MHETGTGQQVAQLHERLMMMRYSNHTVPTLFTVLSFRKVLHYSSFCMKYSMEAMGMQVTYNMS